MQTTWQPHLSGFAEDPSYVAMVLRHAPVDFGRTASDYARHRPGFPPEFFEEVFRAGFVRAGDRVLDLGTGTGTLARGFAERGCSAVGLDPSMAMLEQAGRAAAAEGVAVEWQRGHAEAVPAEDASFDVVCVGQAWHWFERSRAAAEAKRVLRAGGRLIVAYYSYIPSPGSLAAATEELVLRHNPTWAFAGHDGRYLVFVGELEEAGFGVARVFERTLQVHFTHEAWRGRFRACNGVLTLEEDAMEAFDADLARLLDERFGEPLFAEHLLWTVVVDKLGG